MWMFLTALSARFTILPFEVPMEEKMSSLETVTTCG